MKKNLFLSLAGLFLVLFASDAAEKDPVQGLAVWFDTPTSLEGRAVWYGGHPERWTGGNKPITAGDAIRNPDPEWESQSLPLGNGSLGANVLGSVAVERITFNEKTLWRGGPGTPGGAAYYWNANKRSANGRRCSGSWLPTGSAATDS